MTALATAVDTPRPATTRAGDKNSGGLARVMGLSVPVSVILADRLMNIDAIVAVRAGTIIEFSVPFDAELSLHISHTEIGRGYAVKTGENFGLRVTRIGTLQTRIGAMGRSS